MHAVAPSPVLVALMVTTAFVSLLQGAFACVTKPFDVPEFLRTVEAAPAS
jgi:hypothetical protein